MANEQTDQTQDIQAQDIQAQDIQADNVEHQSTTEQPEVNVEDLQAQITTLTENLKYEKAVAANAKYEAEKTKERLEREADTSKKFALEKIAKELLDTVDNLERAIAATGGEKTALSEGVELTLKSLITTLEKFGVVVVDTDHGFNADFHQAVGIAPDAKAGEVGTVLQKGYTLAGRLLRPAMVLVGQ